jgi:hypothetical protein
MNLLVRLLSVDFKGAEVLTGQVRNILVETIDSNGSLRLLPTRPRAADVSRRVPVEAAYADQDGVLVHVLLHVLDGVLNELEIYREDSGIVTTRPQDVPQLAIEHWED